MEINQLRKIRQREGVSLRTMARELGQNIKDTRDQENPTNDLRISDLLRWRKILDVPVEELLGEVSSWHHVGQRRSSEDAGKIAETVYHDPAHTFISDWRYKSD